MSLRDLARSIPGCKGYYWNTGLSRYERRERKSKGSDEIILMVLLTIRSGSKKIAANHDSLGLAVPPK